MELKDVNLKDFRLINYGVGHHNSYSDIYINNGVLFKIIKDKFFFINEVERNVLYIKNNGKNFIPKINELIYNNKEFCGYTMDYEDNCISFRDVCNSNLELCDEQKISAIKCIYHAVKKLHEDNIVVGDIHSDNLLINYVNGSGYLVDIDFLRFEGDEFKFQQSYLIKRNNKTHNIVISSKYSDCCKLFVSSLSLLLNKDLEIYGNQNNHVINLSLILEEVVKPLNIYSLEKYCEELIKGNAVYFDDYLKSSDFILEFKKRNNKTLKRSI